MGNQTIKGFAGTKEREARYKVRVATSNEGYAKEVGESIRDGDDTNKDRYQAQNMRKASSPVDAQTQHRGSRRAPALVGVGQRRPTAAASTAASSAREPRQLPAFKLTGGEFSLGRLEWLEGGEGGGGEHYSRIQRE